MLLIRYYSLELIRIRSILKSKMKPELLKSRDLLESAGLAMNPGTGFPLAHRHLLITSVLEFVSSPAFAKYLHENGHEVSSKTASNWQQATREWLGLPLAGRGKPSAEYRKTVQEWRQSNGNPTLDEIDAGWVPLHRRGRDMSIKEHIEEFRQMLASFKEVGQHDEVEQRLSELMKTRIETAPFKIEDRGPRDQVPPLSDLDPTDEDSPLPDPNPTDEVPPPPAPNPTDVASPPPDPDPTDVAAPPPTPDPTDEAPPPPLPDPTAEGPPPLDLNPIDEVPPPSDLDPTGDVPPPPDLRRADEKTLDGATPP